VAAGATTDAWAHQRAGAAGEFIFGRAAFANGEHHGRCSCGGSTTTNRHNSQTHLTVATGLCWSIAIMTMRYSSDGRLRRHSAREVSSNGRKMTSSTPVATEEHSSDGQLLPVVTMKSELSFKYLVARLFGMDVGGS
jgi:hypothetical protein